MRFVRLFAAAAALACSGQAQAAVSIINGTASGSASLSIAMDMAMFRMAVRTTTPVTMTGLHSVESAFSSCSFDACQYGTWQAQNAFSYPNRSTLHLYISPFIPTYQPLPGGGRWDYSFPRAFALNLSNGEGQAFGYKIKIATVPELSTWALMILGMGAIGAALRVRLARSRLASLPRQ